MSQSQAGIFPQLFYFCFLFSNWIYNQQKNWFHMWVWSLPIKMIMCNLNESEYLRCLVLYFWPLCSTSSPFAPPLGQRAEGSSFRTSCERMGKPSSIYMQITFIPLPERNWQSMRVIDRHEDVSIHIWLCGHVCVYLFVVRVQKEPGLN